MMKRFMIIALSWPMLLDVALAQTPDVQTAMQYFDQAAAGDSKAVDVAIAQFKALSENQPQSPVYKVRLGSLITMQARDAWAPWKKMSYTERGLDLIDEALEGLRPEHDSLPMGNIYVGLDVRYTAAVTFSSIPKFFNRWAQAERLLKAITEQAEFAKTSNGFQAQVWLTRAQLAKQRERPDLYTQWLRKVVALAPESEAGKQASMLLAEGTGK